jgi:hypothetical protein
MRIVDTDWLQKPAAGNAEKNSFLDNKGWLRKVFLPV